MNKIDSNPISEEGTRTAAIDSSEGLSTKPTKRQPLVLAFPDLPPLKLNASGIKPNSK